MVCAIRRDCARLVARDAATFANVIRAKAAANHVAFCKALTQAIEVPWQICQHAQRLLAYAQTIRTTLHPKYRVDLDCAVALARAARTSGKALVHTNLSWLGDGAYSRVMRHKLAKLT